MKTQTHNEEEVKTKIIVPVLDKFGIRLEEIAFEERFNFRVGRHTIQVDTKKQIETAQPRLDILITRDGRNLFVIEAKTERHKLTEEDADQAISYARLIHPIAPYAVTTNGKDTKIYDTVSKKLLASEDLKLVDGREVTLAEELRYEAQKLFLGYSSYNLRSFCLEQSQANLRPLVGSKNDRSKKYIPELHTPRPSLLQKVRNFLDSEYPVFAILGSSGIGKTSSLCHLTENLLTQGEAVLFFRGSLLEGSLEEEIRREFEWNFPDSRPSLTAVLERIESILHDRRLIIVLDAIDEWAYPVRTQALVNLAKHLAHKPLRLILSCKINSWKEFLASRDTPTGISDYVYPTRDLSDPNPGLNEQRGYFLQPLDDQEFTETVENYRTFYSFRGYFESKVLQEAKRNLFLLRVFFEVAEDSQFEHFMFSSREFFEVYYRKLIAKTIDKDRARRQLIAVAKALFDANSDSLDINELEQGIGLGPDGALMNELFEYNILERTDAGGSERVRFAFQGVRDYIIAFHVLKWQEVLVKNFSRSTDTLQKDGVHQEVLQFFYRQGFADKNRLLDEELQHVAAQYLDFFVSVLREHFSRLGHAFSLSPKVEIGFVATIDLQNKRFLHYGFRELQDDNPERILFLPVDSFWEYDLLYLYGVPWPHAASLAFDFDNLDIVADVLNDEITPHLKYTVEKGLLDESVSPEIAIELLTALVEKQQYVLSQGRRSGSENGIFPIIFEELKRALLSRKLENHFTDERAKDKKRRGLLTETQVGNSVGYICYFDHADMQWIQNQMQDALEGGKVPTKLPNPYSKIEARIEACMKTLGPETTDISAPIFPDLWSLQRREAKQLSAAEILSHCAAVFARFIEAYRKIIEWNFPTLSQRFFLHSQMPVVCFITLAGPLPPKGLAIVIHICRDSHNFGDNQIITCSEDELRRERQCVWYQERAYERVESHWTLWNPFIYCDKTFCDVEISRTAILRRMVYKQIESELNGVLDFLFGKYGVRRKR